MNFDIFADLTWRGLIHQTTDDNNLPQWLNAQPRTVYIGFDPTADSLHVGSLLQLMLLRRFQRAGHRPIALVGGATGMIGDPSGKSEERNLLSVDSLRANVESIERQMRQFLDFNCGPTSALLVNNFDWMRKFSYLDFLRDVGKNFPVNVMLGKDSVKSRLGSEAGLSYTEFSYMLLQAYDFVHLNEAHGCELQVGGSDQWGNITAGIDLARRMRGTQVFGITSPLLVDSEGKKIGKTAEGTKVWLSPERTSPYLFYQYWINVGDADAGPCLRYLTELPCDEIQALDESRKNAAHERASQKRLAEALTRLVHGESGLAVAQRATDIFFGAEISGVNDGQLRDIFADVPSTELPYARLQGDGLGVLDAFLEAGLAKSKGDARRTVQQGGAYLNNRRVTDADAKLTPIDLASESVLVLRSGKKRYALLRFVR
ncbi:MAG: tyrosine--tRNA ligase [Planctomycetaceae bacterium]|nr:tyrosine--tRNA ligase [Planctomycetales bacterium]MCB9927134.1 tyrosine--tRNA ligase [Planctomycetaceae bacterium]